MANSEKALAVRLSIETAVDLRSQVEAHIRAAAEQLRAAQKLTQKFGCDLAYACGPEAHRWAYTGSANLVRGKEEDIALVCKYVDSEIWSYLFEHADLARVMSTDAINQFRADVHALNILPATQANIEATFAGLVANKGEMLADGVESVARRISWDHKTNSPWKFTPKFITKSAVRKSGCVLDVRESFSGALDDLHRFFCHLQNRPAPSREARPGYAMRYIFRPKFDFEFFSVKLFKTTFTAHVSFTKAGLELLPQLNKILAKRYPHCLPSR